jgi:hypothetical protein
MAGPVPASSANSIMNYTFVRNVKQVPVSRKKVVGRSINYSFFIIYSKISLS